MAYREELKKFADELKIKSDNAEKIKEENFAEEMVV